MRKNKLITLLAAPLLVLPGCSGKSSGALKIATTFAPVYDYVKRIVKDSAEVITIVGDNEPHDFSPNDAKAAAFTEKCDALFAYGHHMDEWAEKMNKDKYFDITGGVEFIKSGNEDDPHAWLSINNSKKMMKNILDKLVAVAPEKIDEFTKNYEDAVKDFDAVDASYKEALDASKLASNYIVTSHEAFAYIAKDYGLTQYGIGDIADHEPSSEDIVSTCNVIKEHNVRYIFLEELDEPGFVDTVIAELAKENYTVNYEVISAYEGVSEEDYADGGTYLDAFNDNLEILKKCLGK